MKRLFLTVVLISVLAAAYPQSKYISFRIDSTIRAEMQERQIPGLQVAVMKYGLVLKKGSYGLANLEYRVPVTDSTLFSIASMSKAFTDAGILLLVEEGKLTLDDPLGKYFDSLPADWSGITIRRLMNHTSGLVDDWENNDLYFNKNNSDSAFFAALRATPLLFQPGEGWSYGCGPFVLGLLITKISGESYPDFMKHRIFDKLGMTRTRIDDPEQVIPNKASGYRLKDHKVVHGKQISAAAQARGDVGVWTSAEDLLKWYAALQDSSLLKAESIRSMFEPGTLNDGNKTSYGLGWSLSPYRDHPLISHDGGFRTGFNSVIEIYPEDHVCIIVLSNLWSAHTSEVAKDIVGLFSPDYARASKMDSLPDPDTARTARLQMFFTGLGISLDSTRKMARELHLPYYPRTEADLAIFRNPDSFIFIRCIEPAKPEKDIFGDTVQQICLYKISRRNQDPAYFAFLLDPSGKVVYMDYEE